MVAVALSGCVTTMTETVVHDELFTYDMPFDRTYLMVLDAIETIPSWQLESTNMKDGLVVVREPGAGGEQAILMLRRVNKKQTTLELARPSQRIPNAGSLLQDVDAYLMSKKS